MTEEPQEQDAHDLVHHRLLPDIPRMIQVLSQKARDFQRMTNRRRKLVLFEPLVGKDGYEKQREFPITKAKYKDDPRFQAILARRDAILELKREAAVAKEAEDSATWVNCQKLIEAHMRGMGNELAHMAADEAKVVSAIQQTITRLADLAEDRRYNNKRIKEAEAADPLAAANEELERMAKELNGER